MCARCGGSPEALPPLHLCACTNRLCGYPEAVVRRSVGIVKGPTAAVPELGSCAPHAPPRGAPGGSGRFGTRKPARCFPSHCLESPSQPQPAFKVADPTASGPALYRTAHSSTAYPKHFRSTSGASMAMGSEVATRLHHYLPACLGACLPACLLACLPAYLHTYLRLVGRGRRQRRIRLLQHGGQTSRRARDRAGGETAGLKLD